LDYETAIQHVLTVEVSDGSRTDTATITIEVNNLNDTDPLINDATASADETMTMMRLIGTTTMIFCRIDFPY
jgi:hypothetical protein